MQKKVISFNNKYEYILENEQINGKELNNK